MNEFVITFLSQWGYLGVFVLILLETIFPPIPSEIILLFSGFMTTYTSLNFILLIVVSTLGSIFGATILYFIGYKIGREKVKKITGNRIGKAIFINNNDLEKSEGWFIKKGEKAIFICKFVPLVRSLVSLPAGVNKMNFFKFLLYSFLGTVIWNSALIIIGSFCGDNYLLIAEKIKDYSLIIVGVVILITMYIFDKKKKKED